MQEFILGKLFQSSRPGYPSLMPDQKDVDRWIYWFQEQGIRTIICLLTRDQLDLYIHLPVGLLESYAKAGFTVIHWPITDPAYDGIGWKELDSQKDQIYLEYQKAEKPVLIHCSAGMDRSPKIAEYIACRDSQASDGII